MPAAMAQAARPARRRRRTSATSPRSTRARRPAASRRRVGSARRAAAGAGAGLPALRRAGRRSHGMTLIDSHCHLDFPDFADELDAVVARAAAAGVERMVTISTRVAQGERLSGDRRAISRRSTSRSARIRIRRPRSPRPTRRRSARFAAHPQMRRRSARPGSTITTITRRATSPSGCSAPRSRWRASSTCRSSSTPARPTTTSPRFCARKWRQGRVRGGAALLHLVARAGRDRAGARALCLVLRRADVQELGRRCARSRATCRSTACWSRPTRPISRRFPIAASATSRPSSSRRRASLAEAKGVELRRDRRRDARQHAETVRENGRRGQGVSLSLRRSSAAAPRAACRGSRRAGAPATPTIRATAAAAARRWSSATAPTATTLALVDASPDLRWQLIDADVARLDGVLMTHPHADHTHGIDDLRPI